jgi:hypothetical protein
VGGRQHQLDVPADLVHSRSEGFKLIERQATRLRRDEPDTARSGAMKFFEFLILDCGRHHHDHTCWNFKLGGGVQLPAIVRALAAGLHQHAM